MPELSPRAVLADRFELVGVLGRGGSATVYLAIDLLRGEQVALKLLHPHLAGDPSVRDRLRREVLAAGRVRHPHALVAHELHALDDVLALSMPLHPGRSLSEEVAASGPLTGEALRRVGAQLSSALAEAHRRGVLHRDVSPANVLVDGEGDATLTDFGLALLVERGTASTSVMGTSGFVAPERLAGVRADPRSDLYSLGATLYAAATGASPFAGPTPLASLQRQLDGAHTPLLQARPDLPPDLCAAVEALLAVDPAHRPQGAEAARAALLGEAPVPPAPTATDERLAPPLLPTGRYAVALKERPGRRHRRERARQRHPDRATRGLRIAARALAASLDQVDAGRVGRRAAGWLDGLHPGAGGESARRGVEQAVAGLRDGVQALLQAPPDPATRLAEAVAAEAGLPEGALRTAPALALPEFRLVDGVPQDTAERLAEEARALGYLATIREGGSRPAAPQGLLMLLGALALLAPAGLGAEGLWLAAFATLAALVWGGRRAAWAPSRLPLAYPADLRPLLTVEARARVAPAPDRAAPEGAAPTVAQRGVAAPPLTGEETGAADSLVALARSRVAALEHALAHTELAPVMEADLRATHRELSLQLEALAAERARLRGALAQRDAERDEDAARRLREHIERLETLAAAGRPVDPSALSTLRRALHEAQRADAAQEALEGRLTKVDARLLELGSAALSAQRDLLSPGAAETGPLLLERLRRETAAARAALDEVAAPPRPQRDLA
ncbi:MAG: protein kinase [Deltaproteobacteria bacterium]|nr:protein kinase [Deltaproteobacteria bacterium]